MKHGSATLWRRCFFACTISPALGLWLMAGCFATPGEVPMMRWLLIALFRPVGT